MVRLDSMYYVVTLPDMCPEYVRVMLGLTLDTVWTLSGISVLCYVWTCAELVLDSVCVYGGRYLVYIYILAQVSGLIFIHSRHFIILWPLS